MKQRTLAVGCAVICLTTGLGAQTPGWKPYSYPAEGFRIDFPAQPALQKQNVPTQAGTFELRAYLAQVDPSAYFVGICDYGTAVANRDPQTVLQGAKDGALANVQAHLVSEQKITLNIIPGLAFEGENTSMHFTAHIFLAGTTLYQVLVAAPIGNTTSEPARFLDSFGLITRVAP
jgi:hypothetical protein